MENKINIYLHQEGQRQAFLDDLCVSIRNNNDLHSQHFLKTYFIDADSFNLHTSSIKQELFPTLWSLNANPASLISSPKHSPLYHTASHFNTKGHWGGKRKLSSGKINHNYFQYSSVGCWGRFLGLYRPQTSQMVEKQLKQVLAKP